MIDLLSTDSAQFLARYVCPWKSRREVYKRRQRAIAQLYERTAYAYVSKQLKWVKTEHKTYMDVYKCACIARVVQCLLQDSGVS